MEEHTDSTNQLAGCDFLLTFYSDLRSSWNHFRVASQYSHQTMIAKMHNVIPVFTELFSLCHMAEYFLCMCLTVSSINSIDCYYKSNFSLAFFVVKICHKGIYLFICPNVIYNNQRESDSAIGRTDRRICRTYTCP